MLGLLRADHFLLNSNDPPRLRLPSKAQHHLEYPAMRAFGICERICLGKLRDKVTALCRNIGWVPHRINAVRPCCNVVFEIFADRLLTDLPKLVINSPISVVPKLRIDVIGRERLHKVFNEESRLLRFRLGSNRLLSTHFRTHEWSRSRLPGCRQRCSRTAS